MFLKRDNVKTVKDVVERNVNMTIEEFLKEVREPYIKNLKEAVLFIKEYIKKHPDCTVYVVGDYDSDGINATTIVEETFSKMGVKVKTRLPRRFSEGYGLSTKIIDEIPGDGLLITVDNGIAAIDAIKKAKEKGLAVIVIDHHLAPTNEEGNQILPDADIIIDPHTEDESEFKDYCGAGLAYRFAKEMFPELKLADLLVLASIATVTDVMPLVGANRTLVIDGLKAINKNKGPAGLKVLLQKLNCTEHINEGDYGFKIGPTFNACGRLYDNGAEKVLNLLIADRGDPKLPWKADALVKTNERRKEIVKEDMILAEGLLTGEKPIVIYDPSFGEGIIGIIAGRLCEDYKCPCIVFTDAEEEGKLKGSGRSIPEVHLKDTLDKISDTMLGYGGHAGAAGLSIAKENLELFTKAFSDAVGPLPEDNGIIYYDLELDLDNNEIEDIISEINIYAPYGEGNPKPLYHTICNIDNNSYSVLGDGTHFSVRNELLTFLGFGCVEKYEDLGCPNQIECVGYLNESWYNGKCTFKFEIVDFDIVET